MITKETAHSQVVQNLKLGLSRQFDFSWEKSPDTVANPTFLPIYKRIDLHSALNTEPV
jgi:hypothetical protein